MEKQARKRGAESLRRITLASGQTRWRAVIDTGHHPDGKRRQVTRTFSTKKEAQEWMARTRIEVRDQKYVGRSETTVRQYLDSWLMGRELLHENTREGYRGDLAPVYERYGDLKLQDLTPAMLIALKQ